MSYLPIAPFQGWLQHRLVTRSINELARELGRDEAHIRHWLDGTQRRVTLRVVDAVFVAGEDPGALSMLYPTEDR